MLNKAVSNAHLIFMLQSRIFVLILLRMSPTKEYFFLRGTKTTVIFGSVEVSPCCPHDAYLHDVLK